MPLIRLIFAVVSFGPFFWFLLGRESFKKAFFIKFFPSDHIVHLFMGVVIWAIVIMVVTAIIFDALLAKQHEKQRLEEEQEELRLEEERRLEAEQKNAQSKDVSGNEQDAQKNGKSRPKGKYSKPVTQ